MKTSESVKNITPALVAASAEIGHARKDATNPHFKNDYASLESVIDVSRGVLLRHGIVVLQGGAGKSLVTRFQHLSGEFFETDLDLVLSKQDMQGLGSAITYARRYSLASMLNISQSDDDGNAASNEGGGNTKPEPPRQAEARNLVPELDRNRLIKQFRGLAVSERELEQFIEGPINHMTKDDYAALIEIGKKIKAKPASKADYFLGAK
ncbi:MAG: ERF family protein [Nitrosomonas sp.]|nr:ERF family protein [Nitrosomonas sp.]